MKNDQHQYQPGVDVNAHLRSSLSGGEVPVANELTTAATARACSESSRLHRVRPILMSAPMVRATLEGTKTQTRRIVKYRISGPHDPGGIYDWRDPKTDQWVGAHSGSHRVERSSAAALCPYGDTGDRLWVREVWAAFDADWRHPGKPHDLRSGPWPNIGYGADKALPAGTARPSIHMPRWASRITLAITGIRVERLQNISEADAIAEGIERTGRHWKSYAGPGSFCRSPIASYRTLWESINGAGSWAANPWVWVVEFKRV